MNNEELKKKANAILKRFGEYIDDEEFGMFKGSYLKEIIVFALKEDENKDDN